MEEALQGTALYTERAAEIVARHVRDISIMAGRVWTYQRASTRVFLAHQSPGPITMPGQGASAYNNVSAGPVR
jgi:hypothetical protein